MLMFGIRIYHQVVHRNRFPWLTKNQQRNTKCFFLIRRFSNDTNHARSNAHIDVRFKCRPIEILLEDNNSLLYSKISCSRFAVRIPNELLSMITNRYTKVSKLVQQGVFQEVVGSRQRVSLQLSISCIEFIVYQIQLQPSGGVITLHTHYFIKQSNGWSNEKISFGIVFTFSILNYEMKLLQVINRIELLGFM